MEASVNVTVFILGGIGLNVIQSAKMIGVDKVIDIDINSTQEAMARGFGISHFVNVNEAPDIVNAAVQQTDGGADYSFECIGNVRICVKRQVLKSPIKDGNAVLSTGVAETGAKTAPALPTFHRPQMGRISFWRCAWPHSFTKNC